MKTRLGRWPRGPAGLRALRSRPREISPPAAFWGAFREHASRVPRDEPLARPRRAWLGPAFAAALLLLLAGGVWFQIDSQDTFRNGLQVEVLGTGSSVYSYMIWDDVAGQGTFLWLLDDENGGGGGS